MSIDWIQVRKIQAKEQGNRGFIPTPKVKSGVAVYESCLERDLFLQFDHCPSVHRYQPQPITIFYYDSAGKKRKYTPDVFVKYSGHPPCLYEIKYEAEIEKNRDIYEERWAAAREWAKKNDTHFFVLSELNIRTARKSNVWFTLGSSKCTDMDKYASKLGLLLNKDGTTYHKICYLLSEEFTIEIGKAAQIICYAIYHGIIFMDTFSTKPISNDTYLRPRRFQEKTAFKPIWDLLENNQVLEMKDMTKKCACLSHVENKSDKISQGFYQAEVNRRLSIVQSYLKQPSTKRTPEWRAHFCKKYNLSKSTIYRWLATFKESGIDGLVPKHKDKGRKRRYSKQVLKLVEEARKLFLSPQITLKVAYRKLKEKCEKLDIKPPPYSYLEWYTYQNTSKSEFCLKDGESIYKSTYEPSYKSFQGACMPMQVIQMDNTSQDVFLVDEKVREILNTPYLTAAIDCYTRMITGFNISFFPSSSQSVLEVLTQTILSKSEYTRNYETQFEWKIEGFPVVLLVDNGMDYRSNTVRDFCMKYDIILEHVPLRTPKYKAFIEQWFNILHKALINEEIGGIRPKLKSRLLNPELKPEKKAIFTLQEIENWMYKWIIDEYHHSNMYNDLVQAPNLKMENVSNAVTSTILPSPREPPISKREKKFLLLSTMDKFSRKLKAYGVRWEHLNYNSERINSLYKQLGSVKLTIMMDRRDIRLIWIIDPVTSEPIITGLGSGWAKVIAEEHGNNPIHKSAWLKEIRSLRIENKGKISPYEYGKQISRRKRMELRDKAAKIKKSVRKSNEKRLESMRKSLSKKIEGEKPEKEGRSEKEITNSKKEIDWSKITSLPTDDFYSER